MSDFWPQSNTNQPLWMQPAPAPAPQPSVQELFRQGAVSTVGSGGYSGMPVSQLPSGQQYLQGSGGSVLGSGSGSGGGSSSGGGFNEQAYRDRGWTDVNAMRADYEKTGGPGGGGVDYSAQMRNDINSGWDSYIGQLNDMLNSGLPGQKSAQEGIIQNQYKTGVGNLGVERDTGLTNLEGERASLEKNQSRNLKDMASNIRNMFMSGNVYLGSRGAGDSSAANQYSYALTKLGSKARGDIMSQTADQLGEIGRRETNLKTIYDQETRNLATERDNKVLELGNWFNEQQNAIRSQIGQAGVGRGKDLAALSQTLLNQALQRLNAIDQEASNRRSMLDQWAIGNSKNLAELRQNMQGVAGFKANLPQGQVFQGTPQISGGNYTLPVYYGNANEKEKDIFGNVIS